MLLGLGYLRFRVLGTSELQAKSVQAEFRASSSESGAEDLCLWIFAASYAPDTETKEGPLSYIR